MDTTVITIPDGNWNYLPTLLINARVAAGQVPLPEMTASRIIFYSDKDNANRIFRTGDPVAGVASEGQTLLAEETWEDSPSGKETAVSARVWYIKGTAADKLEVHFYN